MVRLASGVIMAVVALSAMVWLPQPAFQLVLTVVAGAAAFEYAPLAGRGTGVGRILVVLSAMAVAWLVADVPSYLPVLSLAALLLAAAVVLGRHRSIPPSLAAPFGAVYVGVPFGLLANLRGTAGWRITMLLVAVVIVSDSLQYYTGRLLGRRPLAPRVSPKKTIEGAVGGVAAAALFMLAAGPAFLPTMSAAMLAGMGVALSVLGICGDLFESQLKRIAGLKDSSHLIPGHGGVLDRVDALLFVTPAFFLAFRGVV
jgi:phosphatidate cytidylyltransferase